tara:strand:- start:335 stop:547 length:213 start_codon:yes stop_codon:yes gene_type:complete
MSDWSDFEDNLVEAFLNAAGPFDDPAHESVARRSIEVLVDGSGSVGGLRRAIRDYINYKIDSHTSREDHD